MPPIASELDRLIRTNLDPSQLKSPEAPSPLGSSIDALMESSLGGKEGVANLARLAATEETETVTPLPDEVLKAIGIEKPKESEIAPKIDLASKLRTGQTMPPAEAPPQKTGPAFTVAQTVKNTAADLGGQFRRMSVYFYSGLAGVEQALITDPVATAFDFYAEKAGLKDPEKTSFLRRLADDMAYISELEDEAIGPMAGKEPITAAVARGAGGVSLYVPLLAGSVGAKLGIHALPVLNAFQAAQTGDPEEIGKAIVKGYVLVGALGAAGALPQGFRAAGSSVAFAGITAAEGGDLDQTIASAVLGFGLSVAGKKGEGRKVGDLAKDAQAWLKIPKNSALLKPVTKAIGEAYWYRKLTIHEKALATQRIGKVIKGLKATGMEDHWIMDTIRRNYGVDNPQYKAMFEELAVRTGRVPGTAPKAEAKPPLMSDIKAAPKPFEKTFEAKGKGFDLNSWAKTNPEQATALAKKTSPSRKDFKLAGLPEASKSERVRIANDLRALTGDGIGVEPKTGQKATEPVVSPKGPEAIPETGTEKVSFTAAEIDAERSERLSKQEAVLARARKQGLGQEIIGEYEQNIKNLKGPAGLEKAKASLSAKAKEDARYAAVQRGKHGEATEQDKVQFKDALEKDRASSLVVAKEENNASALRGRIDDSGRVAALNDALDKAETYDEASSLIQAEAKKSDLLVNDIRYLHSYWQSRKNGYDVPRFVKEAPAPEPEPPAPPPAKKKIGRKGVRKKSDIISSSVVGGVRYERFDNKKGAAVRTIDADTGDVVTIVNYPDAAKADAAFSEAVAAAVKDDAAEIKRQKKLTRLKSGKKTRRKIAETGDPLMDLVLEMGGIRAYKKVEGKGKGGLSKKRPFSEELKAVPQKFRAVRRAEGSTIDEIHQAAIESGILKTGQTESDIIEHLRSGKKIISEEFYYEAMAEEAELNTELVPMADVKEGMTFKINGEVFKVLDEGVTSLHIKDGKEYWVPYEEDSLQIDRGSLTKPGEDFKLESVSKEELAVETKKRAQKQELEDLAAKPLVAGEIDTTGDLFDASLSDNPLFAAPVPKSTMKAPAAEVPVKPPTVIEALHKGVGVKPPKGATMIRVTGDNGAIAVVNAKDADSLTGAGPYTKIEFGVQGKKGFVSVEGEGEIRAPLTKGVGAAAAEGEGEFVRGKVVGEVSEDVTSLMKRVAEVERERLGYPPEVRDAARRFPEVIEKAMDRIRQNSTAGQDLIDELSETPRALTDTDVGVLLIEKARRFNTRNAAASKWVATQEAGTAKEVADAKKAYEIAALRLEEVFDVTARGKGKSITETARGLNALRMLMDEQFNLVEMEQSVRDKQNGKPVTNEQRADIERIKNDYDQAKENLGKQITRLEGELQESETELAKAKANVEFDRIVTEAVGKKPTGKKSMAPEDFDVDALEAEAEDGVVDASKLIKALFKAEVENGVRTLDTAIKNVHAIVGESLGMTPEGVRDTFSDYGKAKPMSKNETARVLSDLRRQAQLVASIERVMKKLAPLKSGPQRDKPTQRVRELEKQLRKLMKETGFQTRTPAQLASALEAVKTRLKNAIEDLDKAIKTRTPLVKGKIGVKHDAESKALKARRDALQEQYDEIFPKKPMTDEERIEVAIRSAERSLEVQNQLLKDAKSGKFTKAEKKKLPFNERLAKIRAERDAAKAEVERLRELAEPGKAAIQAKKKRLESGIKSLKARIANKDFETKPRPTVDVSSDPEALAAQVEYERIKNEFDDLKERARKSNRTWNETVKENLLTIMDAQRNILASYDVSAFGRQGWYAALSHPIIGLKATADMFRALKRGESAKISEQLRNRENYKNGVYQKAKLGLMPDDGTGNFSHVEDRFRLNLVAGIPGINASNRAYATFLNTIRADLFDTLVRNNYGTAANATDQQLRDLADGINVETGRGDLGRLNPETMARFLWAPRFLKSALDIITRPITGAGKGFAKNRLIFGKEYARALASIASIYLVANMFRDNEDEPIEWDPRSSKFGAIPITKNFTFNPIGFVRTALTFLARTITGVTKSRGKLVKLREHGTLFAEGAEDIRYGSGMAEVWARFAQSKAHPTLGSVLSLTSGKQFGGQDLTTEGFFRDLTVPLAVRESYQAMLIDDPDAAIAVSMMTMLGMEIRPDYDSPEYMKYEAKDQKAFLERAGKIIYSGTSPSADFSDIARVQKLLKGMTKKEAFQALKQTLRDRKTKSFRIRTSSGKLTPYGRRVGKLRKLARDYAKTVLDQSE